ncbi:hypothetical protein MSPP1_002752 [Malassezia sp. CBS 17886]|nr:hypothetical protein MSPP1_002752 [Malassezia sp. CBS 17886]
MENAMEEVGRACATQLSTFQRCVVANKGDAAPCREPQQALAQCAADAVPLLQAVKSQCGQFIRAYDACLEENKSAGEEQLARSCTPRLRDLWQCTENVKAAATAPGAQT